MRVKAQRQVMVVFSTYDETQQDRTALFLTDEQAVQIREFLAQVDGFAPDGEDPTDVRGILRGKS